VCVKLLDGLTFSKYSLLECHLNCTQSLAVDVIKRSLTHFVVHNGVIVMCLNMAVSINRTKVILEFGM